MCKIVIYTDWWQQIYEENFSNPLLDSLDLFNKNLEYLGRGYNILIGNPFTNSKDEGFTNKYNPFTLSYDKSKTTSDGNYLIPDNSESLTLNDCSFNETKT